jgi:hypothetical protein
MKFTSNTLIAIGILICVLLIPYFLTFGGFSFSTDSKDWANFGTYTGGTLGPIGAFLAFWGLIQQNTLYRDNALTERLSLKLSTLDNDIQQLLNHPRLESEFKEAVRLNCGVSSHIVKRQINQSIHEYRMTDTDGFTYRSYSVINSISDKIILMNKFLSYMHNVSVHQSELEHYCDRYKALIIGLHEKGWISFSKFQ